MLDKCGTGFMLCDVNLALHSAFLKESKAQPYLLAISGGRDSVALLHALLKNGYRNLTLCHLNHELRGEESDKDAAFVISLGEKHHLDSEIESVHVARLMQENGESMELAARNARRNFFSACAIKLNCPRVLLAHHADDQTETILFNLLRGSGGLKGMDFQSTHQIKKRDLTFIRPLLHITRKDINEYISTHQIDYREDTTNAEPIATRNRLRNEAIPLLENIMGRDLSSSLQRATDICQANEQGLKQILQEQQLEDPQGRLFSPKIKELPLALQYMALQDYLKKQSISDISTDLLERCLSLLEDTSRAKINLPKGLYFRRKEKRLFVDSSPS